MRCAVAHVRTSVDLLSDTYIATTGKTTIIVPEFLLSLNCMNIPVLLTGAPIIRYESPSTESLFVSYCSVFSFPSWSWPLAAMRVLTEKSGPYTIYI